MISPDAEDRLRKFSSEAYPPFVHEITPGKVFHVVGHGHSNAGFIVADSSVILIDTLDTDARGARLAQIISQTTSKPVKTIIYTHGHPDHRGGSAAFAASDPEIIAFDPVRDPLARTGQIAEVLNRRTIRQFGYSLTADDALTQGIGIREGFTSGDGNYNILPPTTVYKDEEVRRNFDGVELTLRAAPGEADDEILIYDEANGSLFCGDNYYGCWPNLYPIRGGKYRDIAAWIDSLDLIRSYNSSALLPGHTKPVLGRSKVKSVLLNYRDALDYVLGETLRCMNAGMGIDATAHSVRLPSQLANLPYLQEFYGTVAWSVRSIYTAYIGWFDGNPAQLNPLPTSERCEKTLGMMGGPNNVLKEIERALSSGEAQWALELCDLFPAKSSSDEIIRGLKAKALRTLATLETSANGRHYYLDIANELTGTLN